MEANEKEFLIANVPDYVFEGESWRAYRQPTEDTSALHRFYNPDTANHFYTTSQDEKLTLIGLGDYTYEGVVAYVIP